MVYQLWHQIELRRLIKMYKKIKNWKSNIKIWLKRYRIKAIGRLYVGWSFYQYPTKHGEYNIRFGISLNSKKYYTKDSYSQWDRYVKKSRFIRIDLFIPWIEIGLFGVENDE